MRILHLITTLDRRAGGPATSIRSIVGNYRKLGHEGEVASLDDPSASWLQELNFTVHALGPVSTQFGYAPKLIPWLKAERDRFDGVVVHGLWQYLGVAARQALHGHKPYMVFPHGMLDPYFKHASRLKHLKKSFYWLLFEYRILRDAKRVLFTSEPEASLATETFWPHEWKAEVVAYGATAPDGDPEEYQEAFFSQYPSLRNVDGTTKPYLLFLGRIHPKKGCDLLVDAFGQIASKQPELQLVLAGPVVPELKIKLEAKAAEHRIEDRIHWTGMLEGAPKWGALYGCDVFVLPSHQENFGIAVAEALACGKPVLISNKVNIWEAVLKDGAAIVAEDDNAGTLELLERWLALSPDQRSVMGKCATRSFHQRYDMQENVRSLVSLFSEITIRNT